MIVGAFAPTQQKENEMNKTYNIYKIENDKLLQVCGSVVGFAQMRTKGELKGSYKVSIRFIEEEVLYKFETADKDGTIRNTKALRRRIDKWYNTRR